jgi:predicted ArsR family transcriptional regulator
MNRITLPPGVTLDLPSAEERYASAVRGLMKRINSLYNAMVERFGDEGLDLIREVSIRQGQKIARSMKERGQPTDIKSVGLFLVKVFENVRGEGEVTEFTDQRVAIKIYQCPYPFERAEICAAHTTMEEQLVIGLNPNLIYEIEKCIPRGDKYCLHVVKKT